jgi:polyphosphate glucokinase
VDFQQVVADYFDKPAHVVNDADMLGLGIARGKGLELVVTLGTGFGTALLLDGKLLPHLEIAHHPVYGLLDYDEYVGEEVRKTLDLATWNDRILYIINILQRVVNYDTLYLAGGNARLVNTPLPDNVHLSNNQAGIKGGARLWSYCGQLVPCPEATPELIYYRRMVDKNAMA